MIWVLLYLLGSVATVLLSPAARQLAGRDPYTIVHYLAWVSAWLVLWASFLMWLLSGAPKP